MQLKILASFARELLQKAVTDTGFGYRYSQVRYKVSSKPILYISGAFLYIFYAFINLFNLMTRRLEIGYTEVFITTRCNLRCRDCSVFVPYLNELKDFDVTSAISDLDIFLNSIDYLHKLGILGGEAMLNKDFNKILMYAAGHKKIGCIRVVTNGTYIPNDDILNTLASSSKVHMNISEYPLQDVSITRRLMAALDERSIRYTIYKDMEWFDLGDPDSPKADSMTSKKRFTYCWMKRCNGIMEGKLYKCGRSVFLPMVREVDDGEKDYINIRDIGDRKSGRKEIRKFLGKKVLAACAYCTGTYQSPTVPPAVQIKKD